MFLCLGSKVRRTPWSAVGPPAGLSHVNKDSALLEETGQGAGRGPGGPPYLARFKMLVAPIRSRLEFWGQLAGLVATGWVVWVTSVGPHWTHRDLQPRLVAALTIALGVWAWSAVLGLAVRFVIRYLNPHEETLRSAAVAIWYAPATILILQFSLVGLASGLALVVSATRLLCPPRMRPAIGLARYFVLSILIRRVSKPPLSPT